MASLSTTIVAGCYENQASITATVLRDAPGAPTGGSYFWTVIDQATGIDYGGPVSEGDLVGVPNGIFKVRVTATYGNNTTAASILHTVNVACSTANPVPFRMTVDWTEPTPRPAGGYEVRYRLLNSTDPYVGIYVLGPPYSIALASTYQYEVIVFSRCSDTDYSVGVSNP